mmetsp:Transcript_56638/g.77212  ORF Transcript_56638/g.77212 Transcript_56638/m.77212 type:complete len:82 (-) Transcript_56638:394-639(-)
MRARKYETDLIANVDLWHYWLVIQFVRQRHVTQAPRYFRRGNIGFSAERKIKDSMRTIFAVICHKNPLRIGPYAAAKVLCT